MTEWKYYYVDEEDCEAYGSGLFRMTRADITEEDIFDQTISLGKINLDFMDGELVAIEIFSNAAMLVSPAWQEGTVENPETICVKKQREEQSLIEILKEKDVFQSE